MGRPWARLWTYDGLEQYIIIHGRGCGKMLGYSVAVNDYSWAWLWKYVGLQQYIIIHRPYRPTEQNNDEDYATFNTKKTEW